MHKNTIIACAVCAFLGQIYGVEYIKESAFVCESHGIEYRFETGDVLADPSYPKWNPLNGNPAPVLLDKVMALASETELRRLYSISGGKVTLLNVGLIPWSSDVWYYRLDYRFQDNGERRVLSLAVSLRGELIQPEVGSRK